MKVKWGVSVLKNGDGDSVESLLYKINLLFPPRFQC